MKKSIATVMAWICIVLPSQASAKSELSFNILFPQTHFSWPVFRAWADDIAKATDGEIKINFPSQSVAPPPGILEAVRNGVADAGFVFNGFLEKAAPGTMVSQMPWVNNGNTKAVSVALWDVYQERFAKAEKLPGVQLVSMFNLGPAYLCSITGKPITTLADLKTRRVWALPGTIADILKGMGLAIASGPAVQVQELASRNTIDAQFGITPETIISFGLAPYTKSCVDMSPAMQSSSFSIFFNQRTWSRLTEAQRDAIMRVSGPALAERLGQAANRADAEARGKLASQGVTFAKVDPDLLAALQGSAAKVADQWVTLVSQRYGVDGFAILNEIRAKAAR
jgi:TRAP-type C4-dicarboxylate transport system substrate-binding protein